jgi:hypothetical protein
MMDGFTTYTTGAASTDFSADDVLRSVMEMRAKMARSRAEQPDCFVILRDEAKLLTDRLPRPLDTYDRLCGLPMYLAETPDEAKALALRLRYQDGKRPAMVGRAGEGWEPKPVEGGISSLPSPPPEYMDWVRKSFGLPAHLFAGSDEPAIVAKYPRD